MTVVEVKPQIFISYARADDEAFVEQLHRDLEAAGIAVWWDRDTMASRGRTFLQEIRDAIEAVDRVIAVIGPGAVQSEYVRYEWEHALLFAKGLLPILRLGDYGLVPSELLPEDDQGLAASDVGRLHCVDFRPERPYEKSLNELVALVLQPVPPLASYDGTPALPPHFLPRRDDLRRLKEKVLADVVRPTVITSAKQTAALQGMGGIGKSVLAAAFARAISTRRTMEDGILWLSAGQDATKLTLLDNMKVIGTAFGGAEKKYRDELSARQHLPEVLEKKTCLIILDDVWSIEQVEPFRNALGPRCRLLITTRDGSVVTALEAQEHVVDVLSDEQALALLADWSGQVREPLPEVAGEVAEECGNLPFALALCGAMARDGAPWPDLLDALKEADLTFIEGRLPGYPFPNVLRALRASVDMLGSKDPAAVGRYHDLAVFPSTPAVPEAAVLTLWCREEGFSERNARKLLTTLGRKALLTVQGESPNRRVSLHDLQHDYLRAVAGDGISTLHGSLVDAYRSQCPGGWASGPDDGHFFQFLPYHLSRARSLDDLETLFTDDKWFLRKLFITGMYAIFDDFTYALELLLPDLDDLISYARQKRTAFDADPLRLPVTTATSTELFMARVDERSPRFCIPNNEGWPKGELLLGGPDVGPYDRATRIDANLRRDLWTMFARRSLPLPPILVGFPYHPPSPVPVGSAEMDRVISRESSRSSEEGQTYYFVFDKSLNSKSRMSLAKLRQLARRTKQKYPYIEHIELSGDETMRTKESKVLFQLRMITGIRAGA